MTDPIATALERALSAERLRIVAAVVRTTGDWELAEDCVQDAVERALARWAADGVPDNPAAWLSTTARRRAIDVWRRRTSEAEKLELLATRSDLPAGIEGTASDWHDADDRLAMLFACCHPALPMAGRVALTLRAVAGMSVAEIARAFLVSENTMGQRLLRTKNKIAHAGISFRVPDPHRAAERVDGVLAVVYLVFNEGYSASAGESVRDDLAGEALDLARLIAALLPGHAEAHGLLALLCLQQSRRPARLDANGELLTMEEQDRACWDHELIEFGLGALAAARHRNPGPPGWYERQARIAALHATATSAAATDWEAIVIEHDALATLRPSPVAALNRAVAIAFRDGPAAGLEAVDTLAAELEGYPRLPAVRADLLRRAGRIDEAAELYRAAIARADTAAERRQLQRRLDTLPRK